MTYGQQFEMRREAGRLAGGNGRRTAKPEGAYNKDTKMATTNVSAEQGQDQGKIEPKGRTVEVPRTVFDLSRFDEITLYKNVEKGELVTSVQDALTRLGNDSTALLKVIQAGLDEMAIEAAKKSSDGWSEKNDDDELTPYTGKFANEEQGKKINGAVLSMAKAIGYEKSLSIEKKRELKEQARGFIRSNPAIIESMSK